MPGFKDLLNAVNFYWGCLKTAPGIPAPDPETVCKCYYFPFCYRKLFSNDTAGKLSLPEIRIYFPGYSLPL